MTIHSGMLGYLRGNGSGATGGQGVHACCADAEVLPVYKLRRDARCRFRDVHGWEVPSDLGSEPRRAIWPSSTPKTESWLLVSCSRGRVPGECLLTLYRAHQAVGAAALAAAAYLDGKYQLRRDLDLVWKQKKAEKAYAKIGESPQGGMAVLLGAGLTASSGRGQTIALVPSCRYLPTAAQPTSRMDPREEPDVRRAPRPGSEICPVAARTGHPAW